MFVLTFRVKTPIKVSHSLQLEVFFSIYGQDQQGQTMKTPGPGGSRLLKIHRPVIVPSVRDVSSWSCCAPLNHSASSSTSLSSCRRTRTPSERRSTARLSTLHVLYAVSDRPSDSVRHVPPVWRLIHDTTTIPSALAIRVDGAACVRRDLFREAVATRTARAACRLSRWTRVWRGSYRRSGVRRTIRWCIVTRRRSSGAGRGGSRK